MDLHCFKLWCVTVSLLLTVAQRTWSAEATLTVHCDQPGHAISPRLVGVFFEDINFGADGGLNSELVKNGSFELPKPLLGWSVTGGATLSNDAPRQASNPTFLRMAAGEDPQQPVTAVNSGFRGIGVSQGSCYVGEVWARGSVREPARLRAELVDDQGNSLGQNEWTVEGSRWRLISKVFTAPQTCAHCELKISLVGGKGVVDLDNVSLTPQATWKNRPHGLRADLVQKLADLNPAFLRFPGGCIVEGSELKNRYDWKATIGPRDQRAKLVNRWNMEFKHRLAPDYYQSFDVGFFEYFQLAEDIGAEPLPILGCGMACQFNSGELVPVDELEPYVQDALDLIEFANGPVTSEWGAKRAAMGHPEPFGMKLLGVGNEQWGPEYFKRYERFAAVLKREHPEIELVSGSGPFPSGERFNYAWPLLRKLKAEIVDEHCYAMPDWFLREATRFDGYDRQGPKVFMGEYAAQSVAICSPKNRNSLRCALAEAAFLTGVERNSDVVTMSAYAPLFGHEEAWQWRPNLIWFDNLASYVTPNYYVQQVFSQHHGDVVLPHELVDSASPVTPQVGFGVGANRAQAEFTELTITTGEKPYDWAAVEAAQAPIALDGEWQVEAGVISQADLNAIARRNLGGLSGEAGELRTRVRVTRGSGGVVIVLRRSEGGSQLEWTLGDAGNTRHKLVAHLASHSDTPAVLADEPGALELERWYNVRVEVAEDSVKCFLDDKLIHEVTGTAPKLPGLFAATSRDDATAETIVKLVNPTGAPREVAIDLKGVKSAPTDITTIELAGNPEHVNSIAEPQSLQLKTSESKVSSSQLTTTLPPYSLRVLRIGHEK